MVRSKRRVRRAPLQRCLDVDDFGTAEAVLPDYRRMFDRAPSRPALFFLLIERAGELRTQEEIRDRLAFGVARRGRGTISSG